jgi:segregation and condensation protein A
MLDDSDYKVRIEQFEGPLDLLLHLVGRARIDIEDIFVSKVTGQYLEYVSSMEALSMESASEFLEMAATLLYIKSRMMLPSEQVEEEEEDPEQDLISRLKTYKIFKEAAESLKGYEAKAERVHFKLPEEIGFPEEKLLIEQMTLDDLISAYMEVLGRQPDTALEHIEEVEIRKDAYTIRERSRYIMHMLNQGGMTTFAALFSEARSRLEVAVTFVALLNMLHKNLVSIQQDGCFDEIYISKRAEEAAG